MGVESRVLGRKRVVWGRNGLCGVENGLFGFDSEMGNVEMGCVGRKMVDNVENR